MRIKRTPFTPPFRGWVRQWYRPSSSMIVFAMAGASPLNMIDIPAFLSPLSRCRCVVVVCLIIHSFSSRLRCSFTHRLHTITREDYLVETGSSHSPPCGVTSSPRLSSCFTVHTEIGRRQMRRCNAAIVAIFRVVGRPPFTIMLSAVAWCTRGASPLPPAYG